MLISKNCCLEVHLWYICEDSNINLDKSWNVILPGLLIWPIFWPIGDSINGAPLLVPIDIHVLHNFMIDKSNPKTQNLLDQ